jgi:hypothetical protein
MSGAVNPTQQIATPGTGQLSAAWTMQGAPPQIPQGISNNTMGQGNVAQAPQNTPGLQPPPKHIPSRNPNSPHVASVQQQIAPGSSPGLPNASNFSVGGTQAVLPNQQQPQYILPPALTKERFEPFFANHCSSKGIVIDPRRLLVDNRPIDLFNLHVQVMNEGGAQKVR